MERKIKFRVTRRNVVENIANGVFDALNKIVLVNKMGNVAAPQENVMAKNWRHVSPSLIRNELTQELIQQHYLRFDSPDEQAIGSQLLAKRIRLQHPNIIKLIYFNEKSGGCSCASMGRAYSTVVYTEHSGDSLSEYARVNPFPLRGSCPCLGILQGATYLQEYYGFF